MRSLNSELSFFILFLSALFVFLSCASFPPDKNTATASLIPAVINGDVEQVSRAMEYGADVNAKDKDGTTVLMHASMKGNVRMCIELVKAGADVNVSNNLGSTALILAVNAAANSMPVSSILLSAGANVNARDKSEKTALTCAALRGYSQIASMLINAGADVDCRDQDGNTPLMILIDSRKNDLRFASMLLSAGANPSAANAKKMTPLIFAAISGNEEIVRLLMDKKAGLNAKDINGDTALILSVCYRQFKITRMLIEAGADIGIIDNLKMTALDYAEKRGYDSVALFIIQHKNGKKDKNGAAKQSSTPYAPHSLTCRMQAPCSVVLSWLDYSENEEGFFIERKRGEGSWLRINELPANTETWTDKNVEENAEYEYRAASFNKSGVSEWSGPISITAKIMDEIAVKKAIEPLLPLSPDTFMAEFAVSVGMELVCIMPYMLISSSTSGNTWNSNSSDTVIGFLGIAGILFGSAWGTYIIGNNETETGSYWAAFGGAAIGLLLGGGIGVIILLANLETLVHGQSTDFLIVMLVTGLIMYVLPPLFSTIFFNMTRERKIENKVSIVPYATRDGAGLLLSCSI